MTETTMTRVPQTPDQGVRLRLDPKPSRTTVLDGAWWPRSTDAVAELPALLEGLHDLRGEITHVLFNTTEWDQPHPRRAASGRRVVRLGWFTSQPPGLVTLISGSGDRFDLLVVPPATTPASAERVMAAAADAADKRRTPELLGTADITSESRP
ncbi:DUF5994 family protein [Actinoplanes sp. NPDC051470]|uniref:DUF5994 family protein n=1 Tax=Actinoplanes sp. NPDC051470 TaxID=3157224 RepID=UPI0034434065